MNPVVVTGMGIVSAAGRGLDETITALRDGRSGLGSLTRFDSPRCGHVPVAEATPSPTAMEAGIAPADDPRTLALARDAMAQAVENAGLDAATLAGSGLAVGTCVAGMPESETAVASLLGGGEAAAGVWSRHECAHTSHALATQYGIRGPVTTLSTACSSAAQAIATAFDLVQTGMVDTMIAGGADALCRLTLNGFSSLLNISPEGCRPFDRARDGMSLGEGAAFLVLERAGGSTRTPLAELRGHGNTCDAHHATAPHPDGLGAERAMITALRMAGVDAGDVDYINAHGTGTVENDRAEGRALRRVFGERDVAISSTKRVFGHTLGAAGAIEAVASILAMREGFVPGTPGFADGDPECAIEPVRTTRAQGVRVVLSNSFGFGGNNSALCFAAVSV
jgi:3-oxoacyl-[acyl-carrier-protein] synthase-1